MSNSTIEMSSNALIAATICPARYWFHRCNKSIKKQHTTSEMVLHCLRSGIRKYYRIWSDEGVQPDISVLNKAISQTYVAEYKSSSPLELEKVMEKAGKLAIVFVTNHPTNVHPQLVGAKFDTPFPLAQPVYVLSDILDATVVDKKGREFVIAVVNDHVRMGYHLQDTLAYYGYKALRNGAVPWSMYIFSLSGFWSNVSIGEEQTQELRQACDLLQFLHISKNTAKHSGLACKSCGYLNICRTNETLRGPVKND